ncbi:MAG TPA: 4Fe-4S cluster-binding domain-containing protein, partial [Desulfomicrobiaceae bacterium]|nr:4Fe-4S cluster-binding domain-containing protein [Desulfomicrobiaceae bacterium]
LRSKNYELLAYTGYLFEDLLEKKEPRELLTLLDMLMDGPYIAAQKTLTLKFRGSANQRIIDVPASLAAGRTVLHPLN